MDRRTGAEWRAVDNWKWQAWWWDRGVPTSAVLAAEAVRDLWISHAWGVVECRDLLWALQCAMAPFLTQPVAEEQGEAGAEATSNRMAGSYPLKTTRKKTILRVVKPTTRTGTPSKLAFNTFHLKIIMIPLKLTSFLTGVLLN